MWIMNLFLKFQIEATDLYSSMRKRVKKRQLKKLERVTLKELILIQLHHIFKNWKNFHKKWVRKVDLSKEWTSYIINPNA